MSHTTIINWLTKLFQERPCYAGLICYTYVFFFRRRVFIFILRGRANLLCKVKVRVAVNVRISLLVVVLFPGGYLYEQLFINVILCLLIFGKTFWKNKQPRQEIWKISNLSPDISWTYCMICRSLYFCAKHQILPKKFSKD